MRMSRDSRRRGGHRGSRRGMMNTEEERDGEIVEERDDDRLEERDDGVMGGVCVG